MADLIIDDDSSAEPVPYHNVYAFPRQGETPSLEHVRNGLGCDVLPVLEALGVLTESLRALHSFDVEARGNPGLRASLGDACPDWRNALMQGDPWRVVSELVHVATRRAEETHRIADDLATADDLAWTTMAAAGGR